MYTCCPICKTNFNVTEAQLQVAQGKVRCGSCKKVFNARQHINYRTLPPKDNTNQKPKKTIATPGTDSSTRNNTIPGNETNTGKNYQRQEDSIQSKPTPISAPSKKHDPVKAINSTPEKDTAISSTSDEHINIDAIFNALDTQLTSGTYIDIAKPIEVDIREAAFDEIFDKKNEVGADPDEKINNDELLKKSVHDSEIDFDVYNDSDSDRVLENSSESLNNNDGNQNLFKPLNRSESENESSSVIESELNNSGSSDANAISINEEIQQHTFNFASSDNEDEKSSEIHRQQSEHKDLHQAIDRIIKIENNIATPFEENDADHFVIEVESEPDVELVGENDIDKLFASTDSLRISDLKFDKYKTTKEREEHVLATLQNKIKAESEPSLESETALELEPNENDIEESSFNSQVEENLNPSNFSSDSLPINAYNKTNFNNDDFNEDDFNPDNITAKSELVESEYDLDSGFAADIDESNIEEEIILSSTDIDNTIPHRLRDAVASVEQQPVSLQKRLLYFVAIIILTLLIGIQLVVFKSPAIANMLPGLQPLLVSLCEKLPCRYTGNHNRKQIKILNRDVRLHPKIKGALLISATITNQASFTQPYPTILLKFTDLTGTTVAQRYFQPKEYLGLLNKPFALMPIKKPIQLNIEILDPGSDAINFQFFFL